MLALTELNDPEEQFLQGNTLTVTAQLTVRLKAPERQPAAAESVECYDVDLFVEAPDAFLCGICQNVMRTPVSCVQGHECVRACREESPGMQCIADT